MCLASSVSGTPPPQSHHHCEEMAVDPGEEAAPKRRKKGAKAKEAQPKVDKKPAAATRTAAGVQTATPKMKKEPCTCADIMFMNGFWLVMPKLATLWRCAVVHVQGYCFGSLMVVHACGGTSLVGPLGLLYNSIACQESALQRLQSGELDSPKGASQVGFAAKLS